MIEGSSEMGLSEEEYNNLSEDEKNNLCQKVKDSFLKAGADYVINNMSELPSLVL